MAKAKTKRGPLSGDVEPLIGTAEVLRMLDVSERQLYRLLRPRDDQGRPQLPIPSVRVGATRKFYASQVRDWLHRTNSRTNGA